MTTTTHLALVEQWLERIHQRGIVEALDEIATHNLQLDLPEGAADIEHARRRFILFEQAFPDAEVAVDDVIAEGNRLVLVLEVTATHLGPFRNIPPTGRPVHFNAAFVLDLDGEHIVRMRCYLELLEVMEQIGVLDPVSDS